MVVNLRFINRFFNRASMDFIKTASVVALLKGQFYKINSDLRDYLRKFFSHYRLNVTSYVETVKNNRAKNNTSENTMEKTYRYNHFKS